MFKRHDCPYIMKGANVWCKLKADKIINNTKLTRKTKYSLLHKMTCSGCEIYKQCGKPQKNNKMPNGERRTSMKNITITKTSTVKAIGKVRNGNSKPVFCITTGEIYTSATDAAEQLKVSQATLCLAASGKIKTCKGKRYCYVKDIIPNLNEICENARARAEKVAKYDKIVSNEKRKQELADREYKLAQAKLKLEAEFRKLDEDKAALKNEV